MLPDLDLDLDPDTDISLIEMILKALSDILS
jgi:hypothetical protein